jgi:hypothetical protein
VSENVVKLKEAKASIERKRYRTAVLESFDRLERVEKRNLSERRAEVERKAKRAF